MLDLTAVNANKTEIGIAKTSLTTLSLQKTLAIVIQTNTLVTTPSKSSANEQ